VTLPEFEYKGLMAQVWDLLRGDTSQWEDRFFFLDVIRRYGQPVLDVGCGTGRLLLDFLSVGMDVDGVDNSPEMLALCRQKATDMGLCPNLYQQYMETLELPRKYQTIIIPSSSLQLVIDPGMVLRAMGRFYSHLEPGGVLVAPFMRLWQEGEPLESEWEISEQRPQDGATIRRVARSCYDPEIECEHTEDLYQVILDGVVVEQELHRRSPATRSYTQPQAYRLFETPGFRDVVLYSGFSFEPVKPDDNIFTVIGQRSSGSGR
jgi:ubiquinone/menaquinone biosynthesis C-methylase UbiE